jgi:Uma2 family endonuclease
MGAIALKSQNLSLEEYWLWEEKQLERHEFYRGEVFCMAGGTLNHNDIVDNVKRYIKNKFQSKGCRVFSENVKLEVFENEYYTYPDIMLTCHPTDIKAELLVKNPSLLVEVLSPSSEGYDLGFKWQSYQKIASLQVYMAVYQDKIGIHVYQRSTIVGQWIYQYFSKIEEMIELDYLGFSLPLSEVYANIEFIVKK